jgi:RNA recognition motif-containing protein
MSNRLYVGNLSYSTTDEGLRSFFATAGEVKTAEVVMERGSGRSKGFGFVEMTTEEAAQSAIDLLNGKMLDQRQIRVDFAKPKEDRPRNTGASSGGNRYDGNRGAGRNGRDRRDRGSRDRDRDRRRDEYSE